MENNMLHIFPLEIIEHISTFLEYTDLLSFSLTCSEIHNTNKGLLNKRYIEKEKDWEEEGIIPLIERKSILGIKSVLTRYPKLLNIDVLEKLIDLNDKKIINYIKRQYSYRRILNTQGLSKNNIKRNSQIISQVFESDIPICLPPGDYYTDKNIIYTPFLFYLGKNSNKDNTNKEYNKKNNVKIVILSNKDIIIFPKTLIYNITINSERNMLLKEGNYIKNCVINLYNMTLPSIIKSYFPQYFSNTITNNDNRLNYPNISIFNNRQPYMFLGRNSTLSSNHIFYEKPPNVYPLGASPSDTENTYSRTYNESEKNKKQAQYKKRGKYKVVNKIKNIRKPMTKCYRRHNYNTR